MAKPTRPSLLKKNILLGVAVSTIQLAGCELPATGESQTMTRTVVATGDEEALFEQARDSGNLVLAEQFLRTYPNSELTRNLLTRLPSSTLRRIDPSIVENFDQRMINTLPFSVKQALDVRTEDTDDNDSSGSFDGYSG